MLAIPMRVPYPTKRPLSAYALALFALACQKNEPSAEHRESTAAPVASTPKPGAPTPPAASTARPPSFETPFKGQDQRVGKYVESSAYKFRVDIVVRCADPAPTETVPEDRKIRVAAKVGVFSKYNEFFVSPKDVSLEKDGVVINSEPRAETGAECAPQLEKKRINHDETMQGFVVFQVPNEDFVRGSVVAFEPTRWGGAPRTEIKVEPKDFVAGKPAAAATK